MFPKGGRGDVISRGRLDGRGEEVGRLEGGLRDRLVKAWERVDLEACRYKGGRVTDMEADVVLGSDVEMEAEEDPAEDMAEAEEGGEEDDVEMEVVERWERCERKDGDGHVQNVREHGDGDNGKDADEVSNDEEVEAGGCAESDRWAEDGTEGPVYGETVDTDGLCGAAVKPETEVEPFARETEILSGCVGMVPVGISSRTEGRGDSGGESGLSGLSRRKWDVSDREKGHKNQSACPHD
ncbi:hypothetical protein BJ684DRAFT_15367 [Piptocephalis cylindrospora]|uniref:Uncharacterized protein n=1 Tax=Piptocephalis cylindrospora TaxID=1907219 RepID=A0A4P9Y6F5_9FUNG|nr:hypothetical protein BJ684DRAFT_15367 [Piptocephalis cylindrospora]|eukprot:RKP14294.1 hypothetical protein BJ684DRAFT_15367 [Piptocephalis cylindrospora]